MLKQNYLGYYGKWGLGQSFTITVRGKPIADLVPSDTLKQPDIKAGVAAMCTFKKVQGIKAIDGYIGNADLFPQNQPTQLNGQVIFQHLLIN